MSVNRRLPVEGNIEVGGVLVDLDEAYEQLKIDPNHIVDQLIDQPAFYSYWGHLAEEADTVLLSARRHLDRVEAEVDDRLRGEARDADEKVTEALIGRRILLEDDYQEALDDMIDARRNAGYLGVHKRAAEQRLQALMAVNNRDRSEMASIGREG